MTQSDTKFSELYDAILKGDDATAIEVTQRAIDGDTDIQKLLTESMIPAMDEVGRRFENQEFFVPDLLISGRAMKTAMNLVRPLLSERGVEPAGCIVIGTVKGDLHDIGKGLVASMLEGGGFEVIDLGVDVSADKFITEAKTNNADIIALSALLTTTMMNMKSVVEEVNNAGLSNQCKVIIGGAPVTQKYADMIGADGYSDNASSAVGVARKLISL